MMASVTFGGDDLAPSTSAASWARRSVLPLARARSAAAALEGGGATRVRGQPLDGGTALVRALVACGIEDLFGVPAGKLGPFLRAVAAERRSATTGRGTRPPRRGWLGRRSRRPDASRSATARGARARTTSSADSAPRRQQARRRSCSRREHPSHLGTRARPDMATDDERLFAPTTKWSGVAARPSEIPSSSAGRCARRSPDGRGPCTSRSRSTCSPGVDSAASSRRPLSASCPSGRAPADPAAVERAAALLARARRPLIIAGGGVVLAGAEPSCARWPRRSGPPATATQMGLGVSRRPTRASSGTAASSAARPSSGACGEADVVLAVGCRFSSWLWTGSPAVAGWPRQELIQIDVDPAAIGRLRAVERRPARRRTRGPRPAAGGASVREPPAAGMGRLARRRPPRGARGDARRGDAGRRGDAPRGARPTRSAVRCPPTRS